jgi:hypothetical protein
MKLTKEYILETIKNKISEMPMDYGDAPERVERGLEDKLANKETPYKDNPAFPEQAPEGVASNWEELLASERFRKVVEKVKQYTGFEGNVTDQNSLRQLMGSMQQMLMGVLQFESQNKEYLENLAVELVKKEMAIPEGSLQFDAKLVSMGGIDAEGFQTQSENPSEEEVEQQFGVNPEEAEEDIEEFMTAMESFDAETAKRRFINALIQGSSKKGHYMFELVANELNERNPDIVTKYGILMSVNDLLYWVLPEGMIEQGMQGGSFAGKEEVDTQTDPPTIKARAVFFPALIHELIKGVMEVLGTQGLPDDPRSAEMVMNVTDTLPAEIWDLRLGPVIWEKFRAAYPEELYDDDMKHVQNYLFSRFAALPTKDFFKVSREILKGTDLGRNILKNMVTQIVTDLKREDYEEDQYNREMEDNPIDGFNDFLGSLGINLSNDDDDGDDDPVV